MEAEGDYTLPAEATLWMYRQMTRNSFQKFTDLKSRFEDLKSSVLINRLWSVIHLFVVVNVNFRVVRNVKTLIYYYCLIKSGNFVSSDDIEVRSEVDRWQ